MRRILRTLALYSAVVLEGVASVEHSEASVARSHFNSEDVVSGEHSEASVGRFDSNSEDVASGEHSDASVGSHGTITAHMTECRELRARGGDV